MNNDKYSIKQIIFSIIFLTWFIGSMIAMFYFGERNSYYLSIILGQYFFVFGILSLFTKPRNILISIPFVLVGLLCIIIPFFMMNPDLLKVQINWDSLISILLCLAFVIAGLFMTIIPYFNYIKQKESCTMTVFATVVENKTFQDEEGDIHYCPVYRFELNGKKYEICHESYAKKVLYEEGTVVNIKINPTEPENFIDSIDLPKEIMIMGIGVLTFSIPLLIYVIYKFPIFI